MALLAATGCLTRHKVDMTHDVKPIHITLDINLKVDRELDEFFDEIDQAAASEAAPENEPIAEERI
jgi:hypothetical protein